MNSNRRFSRFQLRQKNGGRWQRIRPGCVVIKPVGQLLGENPARTGRHYYFGSHTDVKRNRNWPRLPASRHLIMEAIEALQAAEIVVGYKPIPIWLKRFTGDKQVTTAWRNKRRRAAIELGAGWHNVAPISADAEFTACMGPAGTGPQAGSWM